MKQTVNEYQFLEAFRNMRPNQFTYYGLKALFTYLEELEADIGEEIEFDVIGLCCEYRELTLKDINREYTEFYADEPLETLEEAADMLRQHTQVIEVDEKTLIIQNF